MIDDILEMIRQDPHNFFGRNYILYIDLVLELFKLFTILLLTDLSYLVLFLSIYILVDQVRTLLHKAIGAPPWSLGRESINY